MVNKAFDPNEPRTSDGKWTAGQATAYESKDFTETPAFKKHGNVQFVQDPITHEDTYMHDLMHDQGFDAAPQLRTKEEMDALVQDGAHELYRGVNNPNFIDQFKHGDVYAGKGFMGSGQYAAYGNDAKQHALQYGGDPKNVMRMALDKKARVISYDDLYKEQHAHDFDEKNPPNPAYARVHDDMSKYAAWKGYDAIRSGNIWNVLNRGALHIEHEPNDMQKNDDGIFRTINGHAVFFPNGRESGDQPEDGDAPSEGAKRALTRLQSTHAQGYQHEANAGDFKDLDSWLGKGRIHHDVDHSENVRERDDRGAYLAQHTKPGATFSLPDITAAGKDKEPGDWSIQYHIHGGTPGREHGGQTYLPKNTKYRVLSSKLHDGLQWDVHLAEAHDAA